jgi:alanine-glyoxylate transaminase/serine-glyoxylate transaminase/serine-pyruvate transaminase
MEGAPDIDELRPPERTLMGPGPSDVHPRVYRAMMAPVVGYLDDSYVDVMDDVQRGLRYLFRTDNEHTFAVTGTGSAAMETALGNLVEPGETVLVPDNGYFGDRMGQVAERAGGDAVTVDAPWGEPLDPAAVEDAFDEHQPTVFGFVHGETSTGVRQTDVGELVEVAHGHDAYAVADTVASLGGAPFHTDEWDVDVVYSGSQKCLSAPPGASPITFSERAVEKIRGRGSQPRSWYLDFEGVWEYWGDERNYHHTAPTTNLYGLREALRLVAEEGLENRWERHREVAGELREGLQNLGLQPAAEEEYWLPSLNSVEVPDGVDDTAVIEFLMEEYDIEIASGLGALEGDVWRIGCMGYSARRQNVACLLAAMADALAAQGYDVEGQAIEAP